MHETDAERAERRSGTVRMSVVTATLHRITVDVTVPRAAVIVLVNVQGSLAPAIEESSGTPTMTKAIATSAACTTRSGR